MGEGMRTDNICSELQIKAVCSNLVNRRTHDSTAHGQSHKSQCVHDQYTLTTYALLNRICSSASLLYVTIISTFLTSST